jgi:folate-binding protein YgfZ
MSEVIQQPVKDLTLAQVHEKLGARLIEHDGWSVPASYGNSTQEYDYVREQGAGLIDLSPRGRIRVSGSEAVMFLNGLITNDMKTLAENSWMPAVFPTVQGRLIAAVRVARLGDSYLLETEAATHEKVLKTIERFTFAGDFRVTDETGNTVQLSLQGKEAASIAAQVLSLTVPEHGVSETDWQQTHVIALHSDHTGAGGLDIITDTAHAPAIWDSLITAGARPVGYDALDTLRIEAGIARYGRDMDDSNVVIETNLDDAVSFTKGCYIGQEIIIRIKHRGHVAKKLTGLLIQTKSPIADGTVITSMDGKDIGRVTSSSYSPRLDSVIALGYVRYEHLVAGTTIRVGEYHGAVHELPFVSQ